MSPIYLKLQELCKKRNISITALCVAVTGSKGNLSTWKKGNIRIEHLPDICKRLDIELDELFLDDLSSKSDSPSSDTYELIDIIKNISDNGVTQILAHARAVESLEASQK